MGVLTWEGHKGRGEWSGPSRNRAAEVGVNVGSRNEVPRRSGRKDGKTGWQSKDGVRAKLG